MDNMNNILKMVGQTDQAQAAVEQLATMAANYYAVLIKAGMQETLAAKLTSEFHATMLEGVASVFGVAKVKSK